LTAHNVGLRDQIEAILATNGEAMASKEVAAQMPPSWSPRSECDGAHELRLEHWLRYEHIDGQCFLLMEFFPQDATRHLRALAIKGTVRRTGSPQRARWTYIGERVDVSDLEAALA
jgi:hypothetical protein